ncbi:olfactory receptor 11A1-like [Sphaeramia orbicularis]|uniref:olfactory receptor 11A1-like n=1 Tax=Sphaeramia orbicularis TaxID=375764 RepID=UPI00117F5431|nr:olfactory receptor 11A1-like [Sphaeramia orbicularis]XP_030007289.1 olfactory receptor 11A1-like [Sphaeramia orbicularis]
MNSTHYTYFTLAAYFDIGLLKYLFFVIVMIFYALTVAANVLLIVVICVNRSLHEPMSLFMCSLFISELYGCTMLFPMIMVQLLRDVHTIATSLCFLQIYSVHSYSTIEYLTLTVMSYDRYLAICHPLQYHTLMTNNRIATLIAVPWFYGFLIVLITISVSSSLQLCGNIIHKVYCDNYSVVKLACSNTSAFNIYGLFISFATIGIPCLIFIYTYMRILKVCFSGSKQTRHKAVTTCTPHLASVINFGIGGGFELIQSRFNMNHVPNILRILLSLYFFVIQPFFNPLMYGLKISKIRILCKSLLFAKM